MPWARISKGKCRSASPNGITRSANFIENPPLGEIWYTDDTQLAIGVAETLVACHHSGGRNDINLFRRAVKERWPMSKEVRARWLARLTDARNAAAAQFDDHKESRSKNAAGGGPRGGSPFLVGITKYQCPAMSESSLIDGSLAL